MKTLLAALTMLVATAAAAAGDTYAVMSLAGDGLLVVRHRATTGTSLEGNVREFLTLSEPVLDRLALKAVDAAVHSADPSARVIFLGGRDPAALEAQSRMLGDPGEAQAIADALVHRLPATGAAWLVVVAKGRHAASFDMGDSHVGTGSVEGLGYYVDPSYESSTRGSTVQVSRGFIAAYACLEVSLVDLKTGKVVAARPVFASESVSEAHSDTLSPWDALTPERKVEIVEGIVRRELAQAVPQLLRR